MQSSDVPLIPARAALRVIEDALRGHAARLDAMKPERRTSPGTIEGRKKRAATARRNADAVERLRMDMPAGVMVDAVVFALLAAIAAECSEAIAQLEDRLLEMGLDGRVEAMENIPAHEVAAFVVAVVGE